jgi:hypothetical protein
MPRLTPSVLVLLLAAACVRADITFEGRTEYDTHTLAKVRARSPDYKSFIYRVYGPDGRKVATEKGEGGWVLFTAPAGKYRVEAIAGKADKDGNLTLDEGEMTVTFKGQAPPPGPGPGPGPGPHPPPPAPPEPTDPLVRSLKAAYFEDFPSDVNAASHLTGLRAVYGVGASQVISSRPETGRQLWDALAAGALEAGVIGKLPKTQAVIAGEMKKLKLTMEEKLTDARRQEVSSAMQKIADALGAVR